MAKSEFILAFNEIAEARRLPREVILDALKVALVSAYRRSARVGENQRIEVRIDEKAGVPTIWVEKEVVEQVENRLTEVDLETARRIKPDAQIGDMVLVEDTPEDFGRIAAQTAKQVILQRMREAERDVQYQEYLERVGDLVTGTVQSVTDEVVMIGLGRTEAILPRSQQIPREEYRPGSRVRAYVMEVRRGNRGPQIVLSRTHRNMLRRLLEYEVPEIYNGTVEIKAIAREPGARSKVAVASTVPGADPVGACVGLRGTRIQAIVNELREKIDVIEWSPDQAVFISKALSPARVSAVFLDDDPENGRTAIVVVPDESLSLAIGREGQNARLAAKLTGWRIDIKSVTEAAQDAYRLLDDPSLADLVAANREIIAQIGQILEKKATNRIVTPEEYELLVNFVKLVENYRLGLLEASRMDWRARREEARAKVPPAAYELPLEETDLPMRIYRALSEAGYNTVGALMEQYYFDAERLLTIPGINEAALQTIERVIATTEFPAPAAEEVVAELAPAEATEATPEAERAEEALEAAPIEEAVAEVASAEEEVPAPAALDEEELLARARRAELVARMARGETLEEAEIAELETAAEAEPTPAPAYLGPTTEEDYFSLEDLDFDEEDLTAEQRAELDAKRAKQRRRQLIFDEERGRLIAKRRRKRSRKDWGEGWLEDLDEEL